jgi:hypothetical protein
VGAIRLLWFSGPPKVAWWQITIPILALVVLLATIYFNVDPDATRSGRWLYYSAGIWLLAGLALVVALPGLARRVGERLSADDGLVESDVDLGYAPQTAGR